jgi:caffeoyl-CoA O-methyltransferase
MITSGKIEDYCTINSSVVPAYLYELERETNLKTINPRMLSGPLQGRVLSMISHLLQPKRVLEIGTFTAYASLCLAEGIREGGVLDTIEVNPELSKIIHKYIRKSPYAKIIKAHFGDALDVIKTLPGNYDLVFLDAAKEDYILYYEALIPDLPSGGLILADNVLWSGKVFNDPEDPTARAINKFNRHVHADQRVESVILPLRDGLSMIRKK